MIHGIFAKIAQIGLNQIMLNGILNLPLVRNVMNVKPKKEMVIVQAEVDLAHIYNYEPHFFILIS